MRSAPLVSLALSVADLVAYALGHVDWSSALSKVGDAAKGGKNYPTHVRYRAGEKPPTAPTGYEYERRTTGHDAGKWYDLMRATAQGLVAVTPARGFGGLTATSPAQAAQLSASIRAVAETALRVAYPAVHAPGPAAGHPAAHPALGAHPGTYPAAHPAGTAPHLSVSVSPAETAHLAAAVRVQFEAGTRAVAQHAAATAHPVTHGSRSGATPPLTGAAHQAAHHTATQMQQHVTVNAPITINGATDPVRVAHEVSGAIKHHIDHAFADFVAGARAGRRLRG